MMSMDAFALRAELVPWVDQGREWSGWDCWGLIRLAYRECFGIELPSGAEYSCRQPLTAHRVLSAGSREWLEIPWGQERPGDVLFYRPCHVGLVLDYGRMLHCNEASGRTVKHRYDNALWRGQVIGIYRHVQLAAH
jgi:probable lipoprotein NlpC